MAGYIIIDIIQILKVLAICELLFYYERDKSIIRGLTAAVTFIACICVMYSSADAWIRFASYAFMVFAIIWLIYHQNGIITGLWMIFVIAIIDSITTLLVEIIINNSNFALEKVPIHLENSIITGIKIA